MSDVAPLLPPHPLHLATLGLLDNEIGAATLGYIVGPPLVNRFPSAAVVQEQAWLGRVDIFPEWGATAQGLSWRASLEALGLEGELTSSTYKALVEALVELQATIGQVSELAAAVESVEESAVVRPDGSVGVVEDGASSATVQEAVPVATVQDVPGKGKC